MDALTLNQHGEVCDLVDANQFHPGLSSFECAAYSAALIFYAGEPGKGPKGNGTQIEALANHWYGKEEGSDAASNKNGMSLDAEYMMLRGMSMHYRALPITGDNAHNVAYIKAWLRLGYPVMICGAEAGMHDLELGDRVPYNWIPSGNHCIVASGIASDGSLLVHDTASIDTTHWTVRPGPRHYDASKLQLISGTAVQVPWLATMPASVDPNASLLPDHLKQGGWILSDALYSPLAPHIPISGPFKDHVLTRNPPWNVDDYPEEQAHHQAALELSNPKMGSGIQQIFRFSMLCMQDGHNSVVEESTGQEVKALRTKLAQLATALQQKG